MAAGSSSQIIAIAALPLLSRYYSPGEFGLYAIALSLIAVISGFSCLRYETAIVTSRSELEAWHLYLLSIALVSVTTAFSALPLYLFRVELGISRILDLLILSLFMQGVWLATRHILIRNGKHGSVALTNTLQTCLTIGLQLSLARTGSSDLGLFLGYVASISVTSLILTFHVVRYSPTATELSIRTLREVAIKHRDFPIYNSLGSTINTISLHAPVIIIANQFGTHAAGLYSMANTLLKAPSQMIMSSVKQVHLQQASQTRTTERTLKYYALLLSMSLPFILFIFINPDLIKLILGSNWKDTQEVLVFLSFFFAAWIPTSITANIFHIKSRQKLLLRVQLAKFTLRIIPLLAASTYFSFHTSLLVFVALSILGQIIQFRTANNILSIDTGSILNSSRHTLRMFSVLLASFLFSFIFLEGTTQTIVQVAAVIIYFYFLMPKSLKSVSDDI